jgi:hypothetical protein
MWSTAFEAWEVQLQGLKLVALDLQRQVGEGVEGGHEGNLVDGLGRDQCKLHNFHIDTKEYLFI